MARASTIQSVDSCALFFCRPSSAGWSSSLCRSSSSERHEACSRGLHYEALSPDSAFFFARVSVQTRNFYSNSQQ
jgi:hypothetical protein